MTRKKTRTLTLAEFVAETSLRSAAKSLGCSHTNIRAALQRGHDVTVRIEPDGMVWATVTHPFPNK